MGKQQETAFKEVFIYKMRQIPNTWFLKTQELARSGVPDILACVGGIFVAIELKTVTGKLSKLQSLNLKRIAHCGGVSVTVTPENVNETLAFIEAVAIRGLND